MTKKEKDTEVKIIEAAREVFVEKGMAGARMQEIADKAGINKSLLHYYYRSKEKLFNAVISLIIGKIAEMFLGIGTDDLTIEAKLECIVETYTNMLLQNPYLPNFMFNEMSRDPDGLFDRFVESKIEVEPFLSTLDKQLKSEGYQISSQELMINVLSLVVFPMAAKPMAQRIMFRGDVKLCDDFIQQRKQTIVPFIMNAMAGYKM